jgi:hypothetical protein
VGLKIEPERLELAISMLSKFARPAQVIKALEEKFGCTSRQSKYTIELAFAEMAKDGHKRVWRRASVLSALTQTYQHATERADLGVMLAKIEDAGADPVVVSKILSRFDPERATTNAIRCLDMMAKIHGLYAADKVEVTHTEAQEDPTVRKARITELLAKRGMILEAQKKALDEAKAEGVQLEIPTPEPMN